MRDNLYFILLGLAVVGPLAFLGTLVFVWAAYLLSLI
jgi:hypothetical protein